MTELNLRRAYGGSVFSDLLGQHRTFHGHCLPDCGSVCPIAVDFFLFLHVHTNIQEAAVHLKTKLWVLKSQPNLVGWQGSMSGEASVLVRLISHPDKTSHPKQLQTCSNE
jgi:hypothetical protein